MKEIKLLMEHIEDELEDAHTYAELAVEYKHDDPELADLFYRLSGRRTSEWCMGCIKNKETRPAY